MVPSRVGILIFNYIIYPDSVFGAKSNNMAVVASNLQCGAFNTVLVLSLLFSSIVRHVLFTRALSILGLDENVFVEPWRCRVCFDGCRVC